jgi:tRNA U38,U39,U40 pseudouridine synthase TruA
VRRIVSYILNYEVLPKEIQNIKLLLSAPEDIKNLNLEPANPNNLILVEHKYENLNWIINEKATKVIQRKLSDNIMKLRACLSVNSAIKHFFQIQ